MSEPVTIQEQPPVPYAPNTEASFLTKLTDPRWWPTNKWWVATVTAAGTVWLMLWTGDGINTDDEKTIIVGLVVQRIASYITRN